MPQDPTFLPDGTTIRDNLDPDGLLGATDAESEAVLAVVGLWESIKGGLTAALTTDMFSHGQKQLFSLARAVLRRRVRERVLGAEVGSLYNKSGGGFGGVLLLDEFTSSVDVETEKTMLAIIRSEFAAYTVVMISHRLDVLVAEDGGGFLDKVFVMDGGALVEQGVPGKLLEKDGGYFRSLWLAGKTK